MAGTLGGGDVELEKPAKGLGEKGKPGEVASWAGRPQEDPCTAGQEEGLQ